MKSLISLLILALGVSSDQATKYLVERHLGNNKQLSLFKGHVIIKRRTNAGFAMNLMENRRRLVIGVSAVIFIIWFIFYGFVLVRLEYKHLRIALGLMTAGAVGNVYDRIKREYVVDFIQLKYFSRVIFNLADIYLVTGCLMSIVSELTA